MEYSKEDLMEAKKQIWAVGESEKNLGNSRSFYFRNYVVWNCSLSAFSGTADIYLL